MSKITVGCRLPLGLILRLQDGSGNETRVELRGQNADMNGAIYIRETMCGYTEMDKDFWDKWCELHKDFEPLINGDIFAEATESKARGAAKERVKNKTGLEGADAEENDLTEAKE